jgi:hypothetical protein
MAPYVHQLISSHVVRSSAWEIRSRGIAPLGDFADPEKLRVMYICDLFKRSFEQRTKQILSVVFLSDCGRFLDIIFRIGVQFGHKFFYFTSMLCFGNDICISEFRLLLSICI